MPHADVVRKAAEVWEGRCGGLTVRNSKLDDSWVRSSSSEVQGAYGSINHSPSSPDPAGESWPFDKLCLALHRRRRYTLRV